MGVSFKYKDKTYFDSDADRKSAPDPEPEVQVAPEKIDEVLPENGLANLLDLIKREQMNRLKRRSPEGLRRVKAVEKYLAQKEAFMESPTQGQKSLQVKKAA